MSGDILDEITAGTPKPSASYPSVPAKLGLALLHRPSGRRGRVSRFTGDVVEITDSAGRQHTFRNRPGAFAVAGDTVSLVAPTAAVTPTTKMSAAGAVIDVNQSARVARASRLWVEGDHDARLVERIWGDELREMAVVVEPLGGLDNLAEQVAEFEPGPGRSLVVLADHLVEGTKETRIAEAVTSRHVIVVGHPYVDVWQCVRAKSLGIDAWPEIPMGTDWKTGVCDTLGWGTPAEGWRRVLGAAESFADLDPALINALERALDHFASERSAIEEGQKP